MPAATDAGGVTPYPDAIVHMRSARRSPYFIMEAFTPDSWEDVVAFYEDSLIGWAREEAGDMVIFELDDQAAVTISPWEYQSVPPGSPQVLQNARTAIGAAWR